MSQTIDVGIIGDFEENRPSHRATGFQPQLTSEESRPHPLIIAYLEAAINFKGENG